MLFKRIFTVLLVSFVIGIIGKPAMASEETLQVNVVPSHENILLDWNDTGDYYRVFLDGEQLWEGKDTQFNHEDLISFERYKYTVKSYSNDNTVIDSTTVVTFTKKGFADARRQLKQTDLDSVVVSSTVNEDEIVISWEGVIPDEDGIYEVFRDDVQIGETKGLNDLWFFYLMIMY